MWHNIEIFQLYLDFWAVTVGHFDAVCNSERGVS